MKVVIITGASQGIGYDLANLLQSKKYVIYGLSRTPFELEGVKSISCDVTNKEQVKTVINQIYQETGHIDILINNAGMGISGSIENAKEENIKKIFDVNVFGSTYLIQACLPYLKQNQGSKIINIGSVAGPLAIPFQGFYSATKAALETLSNALANELSPYKVYVTTVLPGDTKTNFTKNRVKNADLNTPYEHRVEKSISLMENDEQKGMNVRSASKVIYKVIKKRKPPLRKTIGFKYKLFVVLKKLLPERFVNFVIGLIYGFKRN